MVKRREARRYELTSYAVSSRQCVILVSDPDCELQLPREIRLTVDLPESAAREIRVRRQEQRGIEGIQSFRAELSLHAFLKREALEHRHIPVLFAGTAQRDGAADVAEGRLRAQWRTRRD